MVGEGLSSEEIAHRLVLSPATVKTQGNRAMTKLHARDRAQWVVFAYEAGLVRPGWAGGRAVPYGSSRAVPVPAHRGVRVDAALPPTTVVVAQLPTWG